MEERVYNFAPQVQIISATMAIHNFIRRNTKTNAKFNYSKDESILDNNDEQIDLDPSLSLNIVSSTKMDHVQESI